MVLDVGQIVGTDLSPNANILGNQIADKAIQARNLADGVIPSSALNDEVFIITNTGSASLSGAGSSSQNQVDITFPGLNATPAFIAFARSGTAAFPLPYFPSFSTQVNYAGISTIVYANSFQSGTDGKIRFTTVNFTNISDPDVYTIEYYVLQQTAI